MTQPKLTTYTTNPLSACYDVKGFKLNRFMMRLTLSTGMMLTGCANGPTTMQSNPSSNSAKEANTATLSPKQIINADTKPVVEANNQFGIDLLQQLYRDGSKSNDNIFYSPYSLSTAMAMIYNAANGATQTQVKNTFHYPKLAVLQPGSAALHQTFNQASNSYRLTSSNDLWVQQGLIPKPDFIKAVTIYHGASVTSLDFKHNPEVSRQTINRYIASKTDNRIPSLLAKDSIRSDTTSVLTNAVYFKGEWQSPFTLLNSQYEPFYTFHSKPANVHMMIGVKDVNYYEDSLMQMIELPYKGDELSMLMILPKAKDAQAMKTLVSGLSISTINDWLKQSSIKEISILMPKFKLANDYAMKPLLSDMGMPLAFTDKADFSLFNDTASLKIDNVFHQAVIEIDEKGTVAAAATGITVVPVMASYNVEFIANHPFIFIIRDKRTNTFLFMGQLTEPDIN